VLDIVHINQHLTSTGSPLAAQGDNTLTTSTASALAAAAARSSSSRSWSVLPDKLV